MLFRSVAIALVATTAACSKKEKPGRIADLAASKVTTIGINAYLWRAALDTVSFMPIVQTDSNGGVIVTDWYANPQQPGERMKVTVSILDTELRADAVKVTANRQTIGGTGWVDAPVRPGTVQKLEETILSRARDMRRSQYNG